MATDPKESNWGAACVPLDQGWQVSATESDLGRQNIQIYLKLPIEIETKHIRNFLGSLYA
jgi:hypothetical protein